MFCFIYFLVFWFAWITIGWLSLACACRSIYVCISLKHGFISLSVSLQFIFKKFSLLIVVVGFFFYIYIYYCIYRFFKYFFIIKKKTTIFIQICRVFFVLFGLLLQVLFYSNHKTRTYTTTTTIYENNYEWYTHSRKQRYHLTLRSIVLTRSRKKKFREKKKKRGEWITKK